MGAQIEWVRCWQGEALYIDEKLVLESDLIRARDVIPLMMHRSFDRFTEYRVSSVWLDEIGGDFPENLRDIVLEDGRTIAEMWESQDADS